MTSCKSGLLKGVERMKKTIADMKEKSANDENICTQAKAQHASTLNLNKDTDESKGTVQVLHMHWCKAEPHQLNLQQSPRLRCSSSGAVEGWRL